MLALSIIAIVLAGVALAGVGLTLIFQFTSQRKLGQLEQTRHPSSQEVESEGTFSKVDGSEPRTRVS
jgi:flagellar basal body-associated protein FliL